MASELVLARRASLREESVDPALTSLYARHTSHIQNFRRAPDTCLQISGIHALEGNSASDRQALCSI